MGEFDLIARYFTRPVTRAALGVGDDCALLRVAAGMQLAASTDMLVEGRHFLPTVDPERLGHKALAVNLSDLAACGARPLAFTLSLALPRVDEAFLGGFARGLLRLADAYDCELVGGDTTQGPLAICIGIFGEVPAGQALLRSGARAGDDIWVSGTLGDARLALEVFRGSVRLPGEAFDSVRAAMELPEPRVALGLALRGVASSAIDVSDGLCGDLGHLLDRSGVAAWIDTDALPRSAIVRSLPLPMQRRFSLAGGDDYELLFTAAPAMAERVAAAGRASEVALTRIGAIRAGAGLHLGDAAGCSIAGEFDGFDHFAQ